MTMTMSLIRDGQEVDWTTPGNIVYYIAQYCLGEPDIDNGDMVFKFDMEKFKNGCKDWIVKLIDDNRFGEVSNIIFALEFVSKYDRIDYLRFEW